MRFVSSFCECPLLARQKQWRHGELACANGFCEPRRRFAFMVLLGKAEIDLSRLNVGFWLSPMFKKKGGGLQTPTTIKATAVCSTPTAVA